MSPLRQPRSCLLDGFYSMFGRTAEVVWKPPAGDLSFLAASYRQHLLTLNLRRAMRQRGENQQQLAKRILMDVETLRRKMRGETLISWQDTARFALAYPDQPIIPDGDLVLPQVFGPRGPQRPPFD